MDPIRLLVTAKEAAAALALSRATVYELIYAGDLECVRIGRAVRIPVDSLEALVAARRIA